MRWTKKKTPTIGTKRIKIRFLWFPVKIGDESRWLETATVQEEWRKNNTTDVVFEDWVSIAFISK